MSKDPIPVVLHAHFYQPPRDNPWTEAVERETSAAPFHDWNERIETECYGANAHARIFGDGSRIVDIVNNYEFLSFNVGPTLFSWLASNAPDTCSRIVDADRRSLARTGHGNAIAQAYSHAILPLCNSRDRDTQVRWGIADFRHRFGRAPEAMWLPETACNTATADALARHDMRYLILSPHQAERIRPDGGAWVDVSAGTIDPRRPYRLALPEGRSIVCFFYDGAVAHAMSFEAVLDTSRGLAERLRAVADVDRGASQLVHVATDGETYGHHRRFADRSLAYFLGHEAAAHGLSLTNYAAYLDGVSVQDEVELKEGADGMGTAWSCAHGLGRWTTDCGCNSGMRPGWRQPWRTPLRLALDRLRDHAAEVFEEIAGDGLRDVWEARDDYIEVILTPRDDVRDAFLTRHARRMFGTKERERIFSMLEAHRMTQLMYASCGWFFDDLAGLETTQILKYAGMAMQLLESAGGRSHLPSFLEVLATAQSNDPAEGNGADVFQRHVAPWEVTPQRRVARSASRLLFGDAPVVERDDAFEVKTLDREVLAHGSHRMVVGRARVVRLRTEQATEITYGAAALPERDMHCGVLLSKDANAYAGLLDEAREIFRQPTTPEIIRLIDRHLGPEFFSVRELSDAGRAEFIENMVTDLVDRLGASYGFLYDEHRRTIEAFERAGVSVPRELRIIAEYTLARRLDAAVLDADDCADPSLLRSAVDVSREARELGMKLAAPRSAARLADLLEEAAKRLERERDAATARRVLDLLELSDALDVPVAVDSLQVAVFLLLDDPCSVSWPAEVRSRLADRLGVRDAIAPT